MVIEVRCAPGSKADPNTSSLISSLGDRDFGNRLLDFMNATCGIRQLTVFRLNHDRCDLLLNEGCEQALVKNTFDTYMQQSWQADSLYGHVARTMGETVPSLLIEKISDIREAGMRRRIFNPLKRRERAVICGNADGMNIGISMIRPDCTEPVPERMIEMISRFAPAVLALVGKNARIAQYQANSANPLASLADIEYHVAHAAINFPRREAQVCARILHGISATGIALDLGIGDETVTTYRKRIYRRLAIGSQYELLRWYLDTVRTTPAHKTHAYVPHSRHSVP